MKNSKKSSNTGKEKNTNFNKTKKNHSMKTFANYQEVKRSEKAILIKTQVEETGQEETFWLPLSKVEIKDNTLSVLEDDIWETKLKELTTPKEEEMVKDATLEMMFETKIRIKESDLIHALIRKHLKNITTADVMKYRADVLKKDD